MEEDLTDKILNENSKLEGTVQNVFTLMLKTRNDHGVRHYLAAVVCKHTNSSHSTDHRTARLANQSKTFQAHADQVG